MRGGFLLSLLLIVPMAATGCRAAADTQEIGAGTWKLNLAQSSYMPATLTPKAQTVTFEALAGGGMKVIADTVDAQGQSVHTEVVTMFDGKPSGVIGSTDPNSARVYRRIDNRRYEFVAWVNGQATTTTRTVIAADGRTRTNTTTGRSAQGQTVSSVAVYDKQ